MSKLISIISRKIDLYHDMLFLLTSYRVDEMAFQNLITRQNVFLSRTGQQRQRERLYMYMLDIKR